MARARILVVDDQPGMLRSVERVLSPRYDVRPARTSGHALELARESEPDLAILDLRMPEMDGFELMARLKAAWPDLDVILMTGSVNEPDARLIRAIKEKAFYFIHKPFERDVLLTLVARCLELRRLTMENRRYLQRLERELAAARRFQVSLLPPLHGRIGEVRVDARYRPCEALGGDFLDYAPCPGGIALVVADVSGHGAGAAMLTSMVKLAFHDAIPGGGSPVDVARGIAQAIAVLEPARYVTALCARIASDGRSVTYVNAGHPAGYVLRDGAPPRPLASTGPIIHAAFGVDAWDAATAPLAPGDRLFLYTDGLIEAQDGSGVFGTERLEAVLRRPAAGGEAVLAEVSAALEAFQGGRPAEDDLALLIAAV